MASESRGRLGWRRFHRIALPGGLWKRRYFMRDGKRESRVFCPCEGCRLRFGRMLYSKSGGEALRFRRIPGFTTNFPLAPNAETIAAMEATRRGEGTEFTTLDELFADLNASDY
jgi:hypothetical protein